MHQIGSAPRPEAPEPTPVELQGALAAGDATNGADEPADPSGRTCHEPAHVVRRPDTGGWLQAPQQEQGRSVGPGSTPVQASSPRAAGRLADPRAASRLALPPDTTPATRPR